MSGLPASPWKAGHGSEEPQDATKKPSAAINAIVIRFIAVYFSVLCVNDKCNQNRVRKFEISLTTMVHSTDAQPTVRELLPSQWAQFLSLGEQPSEFDELFRRVDESYLTSVIYPTKANVFQALESVSPSEVKVVIIGQDPYHGPRQAHGLSFSVLPGQKIPPSLRNIYVELQNDLNCPRPTQGYLMPWAKSGVLLLNSILTVREAQPGSHSKWGWESFTDRIIERLSTEYSGLVFILWGAHAQSKKTLISDKNHLILESAHPSPLSARRGFFGSAPFSKTNAYLVQNGITPIDWCLAEPDLFSQTLSD